MTQNMTLPAYVEPVHCKFEELLVAYDFSEAADSALKYSVMFARRFGSFIHLVGVQSPADYASALEAGPLAMQMSQRDLLSGLQGVEERLRAEGIGSDSVRRVGSISDTMEGIVLEHTPDLLLFGAYGFGPRDRRHLGSTAEHLLRTTRCPALVIGPHALLAEREAGPLEIVLCATSSLQNPEETPCFAGHFAVQTGVKLELLHVVDATQKGAPRKHQEQLCEQWLARLGERGVKVSCTVIYGRAEAAIAARAAESKASLILFGLHRSGNRMVDCPDGVVSATIREALCPVMVVPSNFSRT